MTIPGTIRKSIAVLALAALAFPAFADMKAFNAAVRAGDYRTAAAEAKSTWPSFDKASPDTAVVAREFGFASLVAGDNEQARQFASFLMENGASLAKPDDQPLTSAVLFRVADFKIRKGDRERTALRNALVARNGAPGVDMTSVLSWEVLYIADWNAADWANANADADAAGAFLAREKSMLVYQRKAEVHSISSLFVGSRSRTTQSRNDLYNAIADVHDRIVGDLNAASTPGLRTQLWPLKWKAEAWAIAIESYLTSSYQQVGSNISTQLKARPLTQPRFGQHPVDAETAAIPVCPGSFDGKPLVYPGGREYQGLVGSVVTRLETDQAGKVIDVEVLAAVPSEGFSELVARTLRTWTFEPDEGVSSSTCRLDSKNRNLKVIFRIG